MFKGMKTTLILFITFIGMIACNESVKPESTDCDTTKCDSTVMVTPTDVTVTCDSVSMTE